MQYLQQSVQKLWFDLVFMFLNHVFRAYIYTASVYRKKNKCRERLVVKCSEEFHKMKFSQQCC